MWLYQTNLKEELTIKTFFLTSDEILQTRKGKIQARNRKNVYYNHKIKVTRKASRGKIPLSAVTTAWLLSLESRLAQAENAGGLGWHRTKQ